MVVGVLEVRLFVGDAYSLKDKRRVVKSLKDRIHNRFRVSVAEVGELDRVRSAVLAVAMVSNDTAHVQSTLDSVVDFLRRPGPAVLIDYSTELL